MDDIEKNYDALVDTIQISDITSNPTNANILQYLKEDDPTFTTMWLCNEPDGDWIEYYLETVEEGEGSGNEDDLGWLGYLIGRSTHLQKFCFFHNGENEALVEPFWRGFTRNKSLKSISFYGLDLSDRGKDSLFHKLDGLFFHNHNLDVLEVEGCILGPEGCRALSTALQGYQNKSLTHVQLVQCGIDDESLAGVISSLGKYPLLQKLELKENDVGRNSCMALANLLRGSASTELHTLDLQNSNIDDEGAVLLADGLAGNCALKTLTLSYNMDITVEGWAAFSKLLCNPQSINKTYLSNHTLQRLSYRSRSIIPSDIDFYLQMNMSLSKKGVAISKILKHHADFNMQPFFQWDFKMLPYTIEWFERVPLFRCNQDILGRRKLSSVYQFIRGMPALYIESCLDGKKLITREQLDL